LNAIEETSDFAGKSERRQIGTWMARLHEYLSSYAFASRNTTHKLWFMVLHFPHVVNRCNFFL
jgi:hypothetical protein